MLHLRLGNSILQRHKSIPGIALHLLRTLWIFQKLDPIWEDNPVVQVLKLPKLHMPLYWQFRAFFQDAHHLTVVSACFKINTYDCPNLNNPLIITSEQKRYRVSIALNRHILLREPLPFLRHQPKITVSPQINLRSLHRSCQIGIAVPKRHFCHVYFSICKRKNIFFIKEFLYILLFQPNTLRRMYAENRSLLQ